MITRINNRFSLCVTKRPANPENYFPIFFIAFILIALKADRGRTAGGNFALNGAAGPLGYVRGSVHMVMYFETNRVLRFLPSFLLLDLVIPYVYITYFPSANSSDIIFKTCMYVFQ